MRITQYNINTWVKLTIISVYVSNGRRDALTFIIYPAKVNQKLEFNGVVSSCFVILGNKGQLPPKHLWAIFPEVL